MSATPFTEKTGRIINAAKLLRTSGRKKAGLFLIEGFNSVDAALHTDRIVEIYATEAGAERYESLLNDASEKNIDWSLVTDKAMRHLSEVITPPGIVAVARTIATNPGLPNSPHLVAAALDINDPGNAGTLIRIADAFGVDAVVFIGHTVDPHNPKCVRASAGSLFHIPILHITNLDEAIELFRLHGLQILAATMTATQSLPEARTLLARSSAWLFGNEAHGLSDTAVTSADYQVSIPQWGQAESLNLSHAAGICLYESAVALHKP